MLDFDAHPFLAHFPISFIFLLFLSGLMAWKSGEQFWLRSFQYLLILSGIALAFSAMSGYNARDLLLHANRNDDILIHHRDLMMWASSLLWALMLLYPVLKISKSKKFPVYVVFWVCLVLLLLIWGAKQGGDMVYVRGFGTGQG